MFWKLDIPLETWRAREVRDDMDASVRAWRRFVGTDLRVSRRHRSWKGRDVEQSTSPKLISNERNRRSATIGERFRLEVKRETAD